MTIDARIILIFLDTYYEIGNEVGNTVWRAQEIASNCEWRCNQWRKNWLLEKESAARLVCQVDYINWPFLHRAGSFFGAPTKWYHQEREKKFLVCILEVIHENIFQVTNFLFIKCWLLNVSHCKMSKKYFSQCSQPQMSWNWFTSILH